ncbi:hypothetical protein AGRHK599_LOCUS273 [Rhizobium rhizogenes]|jgi:hypothetical protein|uniref:Uncharacterized protein n=1 Tax=Rhizobium rhizogenes TaxID=359 RepID=A0AAN1ZZP4_RHIRH|nr:MULTISPECIES: hypothetical protein [Rhizobium/Agrobacterium group]MCZ7441741.1 hypothetical protein [Rhizobium rhizogenes]MDS7597449.1 hypothetical protein [Agrobacterium tumefaciens]NSZ78049.1 hypothetical protein [Agrobacterium tumefaciens]CAD0210258.1 hypothetical protein AGRHK599_LOCUS273 [Rhizobium rhizogenes]
MLVLRVLCLPIAMLFFAILYTVAIKAPDAVEAGNLIVWIVLPLLIVGKLVRRHA